jgi:flagellar assembly factor FliW
VRIRTKHLGERDVPDERIVTIRDGLFGFGGCERFALIEHGPASPFFWLQSVEDPNLAFVAMSPTLFRPDYVPVLAEEDVADIGVEDVRDALILVLVVIPEDPREMTANLQGPVVIHRKTRTGRQMISTDPTHRTRHRIVEELAAGGKR